MTRVTSKLRLYGHRGASATVAENTVAAFRRALDDGANALELDLHRSADGHFVVSHDGDGRRMAQRAERIRDLPLEELKRWDVAAGSVNLSPLEMPTFAEALQEFEGVPMSVDLKPDDLRLVGPLVELLAANGAEARVTVSSFHPRLIRAVRRLGYPGPTALTQPEVAALKFLPTRLARRFVRGDSVHVPTSYRAIRLDGRRMIHSCRRLGLRVDYWVINDPQDARRLLERGATGIMSDDPRIMVSIFEEFERGSV